jgi:hypothetical protein
MNQEVRQKLVERWVNPEDVQYLDEAIESINKRRSKQYQHKYDITKPQKTKRWEYVFTENDDPYDADIDVTVDHAITMLNQFKTKGYPYVGYEDEELIVYRYELEAASEWAKKIKGDILREISSVKKSHNTREQKVAKIEKLEKQIEELKKELEQDKDS